MTGLGAESGADAREIAFLRTPGAIRQRAEEVYASCAAGDLQNFALNEASLAPLGDRVVAITRAAYPDPRGIPYHSRFRHFAAGGVDRMAALEARLRALSPEERLVAEFDLVIVSVLLDAGAGQRWSFREAETGRVFTRSEGLAVASYHLFASGALSGNPERPLSADALVLERMTSDELGRAFEVGPDNPLVGLEGRAALLRRLGEVARGAPQYFGADEPRPGNLARHLLAEVRGGELPAKRVFASVLQALGPIWPGREVVAGVNLGDVWVHSRLGRIPFHKLSQWLTYSLCEPLEFAGVRIVGLGELTGLAEYRNGGLFVDGGVLQPKHAGVTADVHAVGSDVVIEWRAMTIALLDRIAVHVQRKLGRSAEELPLAKVLEGGTWSAGRILAREKRADGAPPIRVDSDGTVF